MAKVSKCYGKGKKNRVLGPAQVVSAEEYAEYTVDTKVELIRQLIPLGLMCVQELLEQEVTELAGARYARGQGKSQRVRYGSNPGSVKLAGQKVPLQVPRVRDLKANREVQLQSWEEVKQGCGEVDVRLLSSVLHGLSCREYEQSARLVPQAIGLSASTVSRQVVQATAQQLRELQERDLSEYDLVAMFLDGKTFAEDTMVVALGITLGGEKVFLGLVQAGTENKRVLSEFLEHMLERGLQVQQGLLVVVDGSRGLGAAVREVLGGQALVQRCQWHKRENVVSYLPLGEQEHWRAKLQRAYQKGTYAEAKGELLRIHKELEERNHSAARSLMEGLEETLTLHRLGVFELVGGSLKTTNCLESIFSQVARRCGRICYWRNSSQKQRWLAAALLDLEPRLNRIRGYRHLPHLRQAVQQELGLQEVKESA